MGIFIAGSCYQRPGRVTCTPLAYPRNCDWTVRHMTQTFSSCRVAVVTPALDDANVTLLYLRDTPLNQTRKGTHIVQVQLVRL